MVVLEMKVGRNWLDVGNFDDIEEAKFCMFDGTRDYQILDENGKVISKHAKLAKRWQDLI